jgi:hypothetical protein
MLFVVGILRFQKWFDVDVLDFKIELCCRHFGLFAWRLFGLLFKKFGNFYNLLVTLVTKVIRTFMLAFCS